MEWYQALILGIVEGITEYLPVSSTGHLILAASLMGLSGDVDKDSLDAFNVVIQGGAILAVLGLYRARIAQMVRGLLGRDDSGRRLAWNVFIAFLPAAILGPLLAGTIKRHLFFPIPVMSALALGGVVMIFIGRWQRRVFHAVNAGPEDAHRTYMDLETLTYARAFVIGLLQCVAMWPGTSRSMVTIVGGMLVGMKPRHAAEFSFLLGLPTLTGACVYDAANNLLGDGENMLATIGIAPILIGLAVATASAALAVKWLVSFLTRHGLALFGWYRLVLCAVLGVMIWQGLVVLSPEQEEAAAATTSEHEQAKFMKLRGAAPVPGPADRCS